MNKVFLVATLKSGRDVRVETILPVDSDLDKKMEEFHNALDFTTLNTLRLGGTVIFAREIETLQYVVSTF